MFTTLEDLRQKLRLMKPPCAWRGDSGREPSCEIDGTLAVCLTSMDPVVALVSPGIGTVVCRRHFGDMLMVCERDGFQVEMVPLFDL